MRAAWIGLVAALLLAPGLARADDASEARFFDALGRRSFDRGDYGAALESFLLAYTAASSPALAYNVAVCADLLGEERMAFTYFQRYLDDAQAQPDRRARAEAALARLRPRLRIVTVVSEPPGATVFLDTVERGAFGRTPTDLALERGRESTLLLRAEGHLDARQRIGDELESGAVVTVRLEPETGTVQLDVDPPSARVSVLRGDTPILEGAGDATLQVPVGRYRVLFSAPGHATAERLVAVRVGDAQALRVELPILSLRTGLLLLSSAGVPATVRLDDRPVGRTPLRLPGVAPGSHRVELRADDGRSWRREVEVAAGASQILRARFDQNGRRQERPLAP